MERSRIRKPDKLADLEEALVDMEKALSLLELAYGLTLIRIEKDGIWKESGAPNLPAYQIEQLDQLGIPKTILSTRKMIARGYMETKDDLGGLPLQGDLSRLIDLPRVIKAKGKEDALYHFKNDSWRDWEAYVKSCEILHNQP